MALLTLFLGSAWNAFLLSVQYIGWWKSLEQILDFWQNKKKAVLLEVFISLGPLQCNFNDVLSDSPKRDQIQFTPNQVEIQVGKSSGRLFLASPYLELFCTLDFLMDLFEILKKNVPLFQQARYFQH